MPTWGQILAEINGLLIAAQQGVPLPASPFDIVRRKYMAQLAQLTGRNAILYASNWTGGLAQDGSSASMTAEDIQGFMEVVHGLAAQTPVDLILHLPGGRAEATEAIVHYVRSKFSDFRVVVPHAAMSAATMLACGSDRIMMGKHSFLGPIDPQFPVRTANGLTMMVAAHAILAQWQKAQLECADPAKMPSWLPILQHYGPALLVQCELAQELSQDLVEEWLTKYMLASSLTGPQTAKQIAAKLADHATFKSHGRFLPRDQLRALGLVIDDLEADQRLQDAVLSVFHATMHTFNGTPASKIIENHVGKSWVKIAQQVLIQQGQPSGPNPAPTPPVPPPGPSKGRTKGAAKRSPSKKKAAASKKSKRRA